jgi:hypothetical protein
MLFLAYNIMILSTDGVQLTDEPKVRRLQSRHFHMLRRYLQHKYKSAGDTYFRDGLALTGLGLEAFRIRTHRLPV